MLLRNPPRATHTLTDIRQRYSRDYEIKTPTSVERIGRQFYMIEKDFGVTLHRPIYHWVDRLVAQSKLWHMRPSDTIAIYEAHYRETISLLRYDGETLPQCECNETSGNALPCPHVFALFREIGGSNCFPVQVIAPRWIPNFGAMEMPTLPRLQIEEHNQMLRALLNVSSESEPEEGGGEEGPGDGSEFPEAVSGTDETAADRHRRVLHLSKEIAPNASRNEGRHNASVDALREIRDSLSEVVTAEIRDPIGKPRGRPRGSGHSHPEVFAPKHCPLCDSTGHHFINCRYSPIFRSEQAKL
jgi:hypothetical protein